MLGNEPIFTPEETAINLQRRQALFEIVANGEALLMAGAGCSASLFPMWGELMDLMGTEARSVKPEFPVYVKKTDPLLYAEAVKQCLGLEKYFQLIYATFSKSKSSATHHKYHESLCRLLDQRKLKAILTTNFDPCFQHALAKVTHRFSDPVIIDKGGAEQADLYEYMWSWDTQTPIKRILHFHGFNKHRGSIVLADSEYREKYGFSVQGAGLTLRDELSKTDISVEQINHLTAAYDHAPTLHRNLLWASFPQEG